jgi:hypothetical protein
MLLWQGVLLGPWVLASMGVTHPASYLVCTLLMVAVVIMPSLWGRRVDPAVRVAVLTVTRLLPCVAAQADAHAFRDQLHGIAYMEERWKMFAGIGWFHGLLLRVRDALAVHHANCILLFMVLAACSLCMVLAALQFAMDGLCTGA